MRDATDNESEHARYCDMIVNEPQVLLHSPEEVVWANGDDRIILVTDLSPDDQRDLAHAASQTANQEMRYDGGIYRSYDPPDERQIHIFLYLHASHVVGLQLMERRTTVWLCQWQNDGNPVCVEHPEIDWMWSVGFIWVHRQHRNSGIAGTLFSEARRHMQLNESEVGWYSPFSEDGERFVRRLYPAKFFVAK